MIKVYDSTLAPTGPTKPLNNLAPKIAFKGIITAFHPRRLTYIYLGHLLVPPSMKEWQHALILLDPENGKFGAVGGVQAVWVGRDAVVRDYEEVDVAIHVSNVETRPQPSKQELGQ